MTIRFDAVPPLDPKVAAFAGGKHAMLVIAQVPAGDGADVDLAVRAARTGREPGDPALPLYSQTVAIRLP